MIGLYMHLGIPIQPNQFLQNFKETIKDEIVKEFVDDQTYETQADLYYESSQVLRNRFKLKKHERQLAMHRNHFEEHEQRFVQIESPHIELTIEDLIPEDPAHRSLYDRNHAHSD